MRCGCWESAKTLGLELSKTQNKQHHFILNRKKEEATLLDVWWRASAAEKLLENCFVCKSIKESFVCLFKWCVTGVIVNDVDKLTDELILLAPWKALDFSSFWNSSLICWHTILPHRKHWLFFQWTDPIGSSGLNKILDTLTRFTSLTELNLDSDNFFVSKRAVKGQGRNMNMQTTQLEM